MSFEVGDNVDVEKITQAPLSKYIKGVTSPVKTRYDAIIERRSDGLIAIVSFPTNRYEIGMDGKGPDDSIWKITKKTTEGGRRRRKSRSSRRKRRSTRSKRTRRHRRSRK